MIPQKKKQKTIIKLCQVTSTSKKCIINPKKAALVFEIYENKECLVVKSKKKKKTASTVTTTFFEQKITTAQS